MPGLLEIDQKRAGRAYSQRIPVHGEAFERLDSELLLELLLGGIIDEGPFLEGGDVEVVPVLRPHSFLAASLDDYFLRRERGKEGPHIVKGALGHLEGAGRDVEEGSSAEVLLEGQASKEVVFLLVEKLIVEGDSRGDEFSDSALDKLFGKFRILKLVADSHLVPGTDEFGEVDVDRMMREACHLDVALFAVGLLCQHKSEHLADQHGIRGI